MNVVTSFCVALCSVAAPDPSSAHDALPGKIPAHIYADPDRIVREVVGSMDPVPVYEREVMANPERYRESLRKLARDTTDSRDIIVIAEIGFHVFEAQEYLAVADRALRLLPDTNEPLNVEIRNRLIDYSKQARLKINNEQNPSFAQAIQGGGASRGAVVAENETRHSVGLLSHGGLAAVMSGSLILAVIFVSLWIRGKRF